MRSSASVGARMAGAGGGGAGIPAASGIGWSGWERRSPSLLKIASGVAG